MDTVTNTAWQRKGSCVIFDQKILGSFIAGGAVDFSKAGSLLIQGVSGCTPIAGRTILISGLKTVIETMESQETEDFCVAGYVRY